MNYTSEELHSYLYVFPYGAVPSKGPVALQQALLTQELLDATEGTIEGIPVAALRAIIEHKRRKGTPQEISLEALRTALTHVLVGPRLSSEDLRMYASVMPDTYARTPQTLQDALTAATLGANSLQDDDLLEGIPVEMLRVFLRHQQLGNRTSVTREDLRRVLNTMHQRRERKKAEDMATVITASSTEWRVDGLAWSDHPPETWEKAMFSAYAARSGARPSPVGQVYYRHDNPGIQITPQSPSPGFFSDGSGTLLDVRPWLPGSQITPPPAPEKNMATEEITTPKKTKKTAKEQATLLGGAMAQGIGMGLTNQAGEVLLEMASSLAPGNKYIQDALKDPAGRELIKVTLAVLLHTACESGAPLPGAAHIATATRSQVAFSSAILTGYAIKNLGTQLTALVDLGKQLEALPPNVPVEHEDFEEAEVTTKTKAARR